jgi:cell division initiation protein
LHDQKERSAVSTGDPEVPFAASGEQIRQREFATVRRGYDPAQVRGYLAMLAAHVETLERTLADAQVRVRQIEDAAPPPTADADPYEQISRRFASVLSSADVEADRVVDHARAEAERIKDEAQASAEEARIRASQALIDAREESDRMLANLAERRETMLSQLHEMQSRLLAMAQDLEGKNQSSTPAEEPGPAAPEDRQAEYDAAVEDLWIAAEASSAVKNPPSSTSDDSPSSSSDDVGLEGLFDAPSDGGESESPVELPDLSSIEFDFDEPETER